MSCSEMPPRLSASPTISCSLRGRLVRAACTLSASRTTATGTPLRRSADRTSCIGTGTPRAQAEVMIHDTVIFAEGDEHQTVTPFAYDDSAYF